MIFLNKFALFLIRTYKFFLSPYSSYCCRFYPSCADYAVLALKRYNFFKAFFLIFKRLLKCNPFFRGGFDEVPK